MKCLLKAKKDKQLGDLGEELVLRYEKKKLIDIGKTDLANAVEHVSKTQGDGTGYDIKSFNSDGKDIYIEVKTTKLGIDTEFYMSPNEIEFSVIVIALLILSLRRTRIPSSPKSAKASP